jgi:hypothetical protein
MASEHSLRGGERLQNQLLKLKDRLTVTRARRLLVRTEGVEFQLVICRRFPTAHRLDPGY